MKQIITICGIILFGLGVLNAQPKKLKVYISADMEGIGGVATWSVQGLPPGREYEKFRQLMTQEVNAAIVGAFDAGATEILVSDSHGDAQNIDIEQLDKRARLVRSWPRPLGMMEGIDKSFDAVIFIGYHAGEGTPGAVLAHTFTGRETIKLNGTEVGEAGFNAAIAADFDVPIVFLSGDQIVTQQAREQFKSIETATVKESLGFNSVITIAPEEAQRLIREGVKRGVERRKEISMFKVSHPIKMELTYRDLITAEVAAYLPGVERSGGNKILYTVQNMADASKFRTVISYLHP